MTHLHCVAIQLIATLCVTHYSPGLPREMREKGKCGSSSLFVSAVIYREDKDRILIDVQTYWVCLSCCFKCHFMMYRRVKKKTTEEKQCERAWNHFTQTTHHSNSDCSRKYKSLFSHPGSSLITQHSRRALTSWRAKRTRNAHNQRADRFTENMRGDNWNTHYPGSRRCTPPWEEGGKNTFVWAHGTLN